jgi:hypothetical protein
MHKVIASSLVLGLLGVWSGVAFAADPVPAAGDAAAPAGGAAAPATAPADAPAAEPTAADPTAPPAGNATAPDKDSGLVADAEAGGSPVELPGKTYMFVGARYRAIIVPKFMINLFGDGGKTVVVHGFGPEFAFRKNAFEYNLSIWYAGYGMDDTPFKAKDDGAPAWELVKSELKSIFITSDFLWSQDFSPEFSLNYGLAGGFGIVFGDLYRVQAKPGSASADANTGAGFVRCTGPGDLDFRGDPSFCDDSNKHYGDNVEPSWADGGSKPILFPWFVLQTGLRYKPHRNFAARLDAGFGTSGFFLGIGADYGI